MAAKSDVPVRLGCSVYVPYRYPCALNSNLDRTQACLYPGVYAEAVHSILQTAGITFSVHPINITFADFKKYGFSGAITREIEAGKYDSFCGFFSYDEQKYPNLEASYPMIMKGLGHGATAQMVSRDHVTDETSLQSIFGLFRIIDVYSWISIGVLCVFAHIYLRLLKLVANGPISDKTQTHTQTSGRSKSKSRQSVSLTVTWLILFLALFGSLYSNGLLSAILVPDLRPNFSNLKEMIGLLSSGRLTVTTSVNSVWFKSLINYNGTEQYMMELSKALAKNDVIDSFFFGNNKTAQLEYTLRKDMTVLGEMTDMRMASRGMPTIRMIPLPQLQVQNFVLLFHKNLSKQNLDRINSAIVSDSAAFESISSRYRENLFHSQKNSGKILREKEPVNWARFRGIFVLLIFGYAFSGLSLFIEKLAHFCDNRIPNELDNEWKYNY